MVQVVNPTPQSSLYPSFNFADLYKHEYLSVVVVEPPQSVDCGFTFPGRLALNKMRNMDGSARAIY